MPRAVVVLGVICGVLVVVAAAAVAAYKIAYPSYTHRLRLTVEVSVDGQLRSGSGVIEVVWQNQPPPASTWHCSINGDAVPVDLGNGLQVFALIQQVSDGRGNRRDGVCYLALTSYGLGVQQSDDSLEALSRKRGRVPAAERAMPTFLMFTDSGDPASAVVVQPRDFPALLGGAKLVGVWVELTNQAVTRDVVKTVPAVAKLIKEYTGRERGRRGIFPLRATHFTRPLEAQSPYARTPPRRRAPE